MKTALLGGVFLLYPLIVFLGLKWIEPSLVAFILVILALLRYRFSKSAIPIPFLKVMGINVIVLLSFSVLANSAFLLKLYPVVMSLSFFTVFAYSLWKPPAVITLIAETRDQLTEKGRLYTESVTKIWCIFFLVNAAIAFWTIFLSDDYWLLYNGLISYVLMGVLFVCEWLIRRILKKNDQSNLIT